ncbi:hypothetical protein GCM10027577_32990 [Spirosoma fluminis]
MLDEIVSPDRTYKVVLSRYEVRMSHWIDQPYLMRVGDGACLFALDGAPWSASDVNWLDETTVRMNLRKYPGRIACTVRLETSDDWGAAQTPGDSFSGSLAQVSNWVLNL